MRTARALLMLVLMIASTTPVQTQTASDVNEGLIIRPQEWQGDYTLSWWGRAGKTYYLQQSDNLVNWTYLPIIELGDDAPMNYGIASNASRSFFRVRYVNPSSAAAPTALSAVGTSSTSAHLSWTPADATKATTIEISTDGGSTWRVLVVVAAGVTTLDVTGMFTDSESQFRVRSGGTATTTAAAPTAAATQTAPPDGSPVSAPAATVGATPLGAPVLVGRGAGSYSVKHGYEGYFDSTKRYLKRVTEVTSHVNGQPTSGHQFVTDVVAPRFGLVTTTTSGTPAGDYALSPWLPVSDTSRSHDYFDAVKNSSATQTLSNPYTTAQLMQNVESWAGGYSGDFYPNTNGASRFLVPDETYYAFSKMQYKWLVNKQPGQVVTWVEVFTPQDGSPPVAEPFSWVSGADTESPIYEIDPRAKNGGALGTYEVMRIGISTSSDYLGGVVKTANTGSGVRHFVSPKKTIDLSADYVDFRASIDDAGLFDALFTWEGGEAGDDANLRKVKRDTAGLTELKIKTKQGNIVVAQMNVWVVWCDITPTFGLLKGVVPDAISGGVRGSKASGHAGFTATISPASIVAVGTEIPDLTGAPISDVPEVHTGPHALDGQIIAPPGPGNKWDLSRRWRARSIAPTLTGSNCDLIPGTTIFGDYPTAVTGKIHQTTPNPGADNFPDFPIEGNDYRPLTQDPYHTFPGSLRDDDQPVAFVKTLAGAVGDHFEAHYQYGEFARLEIAGRWFRISDFKAWRFHALLKKASESADQQDYNGDGDQTDEVWIDDGTLCDLSNAGF